MDSRKTISDEISALSEQVALISHDLPFSPPPAGYFDQLAATVLLRIKAGYLADKQEDELSSLLQSINKNPLYSIPEGYFVALPGRVLDLIRAENAVDSHSAEELDQLSPLLGKISKQMPFSVPAGYFDALSAGIGANTGMGKEEDYIVLAGISRQNVYEVPADYFNALPSVMLRKVNATPARVVSMGSVRKMMRYSAAAVVAGALIIGGLFYFWGGNTRNAELAANTISITPSAPSAIENLSDSDMVNYLETQNLPLPDEAFAAAADMNSDDMLDILSDVPDETLRQYLALYSDTKENMIN